MPFGYPQNPEPKVNIDYNRCQPVSVIAVYNQEGKIKPLYVSLSDMYGNVCKAEITGVKYSKDITGGISFRCLYKAGSRLKECTLKFYYDSHVWVLEN